MLTAYAKDKKRTSRQGHGQQSSKPRKDDVSSSQATSQIKSKATKSSPTTVEVRGIQVHFPFQPYKCQEAYMGKVLDALNCAENALLESPTGTGKTLCLLCSTLAWQQEQKGLLSDPLLAQGMNVKGGDAKPPAQSTSLSQQSQSSSSRPRVPTIIYASRTHSQLSQVVKELRFTRYRPKHAVLGSREQMCIHPRVRTKNALASEINHNCTRINKNRKCKFRNNLEGFMVNGCDVNSRSNSKTSSDNTEAFGMQPVLDMEELVELGNKRKVCPFYLTRGQIEDAEVIFVPYNYLFDKDARSSTLADVQWENSILIFDEAHNLESFASESASFDLTGPDIGGCVNEVQRAIGYLQAMPELAEGGVKMDNLIRLKSIFLQLETYLDQKLAVGPDGGSYVGEFIFDIFAKGANLTYANHSIFLKFLRQVSDMIMEIKGGSGSTGSKTSGTPKLEHFAGCVKRVFGTATEGQCLARARAYRVHISAKSSNQNGKQSAGGGGFVNVKDSRAGNSGRVLSYWCFAPSLAMNELAALNVRSILVTSGTLSPLPSYSLELGLSFPHTLENEHIIGKDQISVQVLGKGVSGKDLTSTYKRRNDHEYIKELGNTIVSLGKVIPGSVLIFFPSYSVMEKCVEQWGGPATSRSKSHYGKNNFFQARQKSKNIASGPAKYCFPRSVHRTSQGRSASSSWQRLNSIKSIVLEPKTTTELKDVIAEFEKYNEAQNGAGSFLLGVCRGKISEGIDFADNKCRAVIITGIPFAPYHDPKVKLKREYLDGVKVALMSKPSGDGGFDGYQNGGTSGSATPISLSGEEWYSQQAHRAVNQAIGRVIRHKEDYGAILFLESRYSEKRHQNGVSQWIRPSFTSDLGMGGTIRSLVKFYRGAREKADANKRRLDGGTKPGIVLKYENDHGESAISDDELEPSEKIKKVTFVKKSSSVDAKSGSELEGEFLEGYVPPNQIIKEMRLDEIPTKKKIDNDNSNVILPQNLSRGKGLTSLFKSKNEDSFNSRSRNHKDINRTIESAWSKTKSEGAKTADKDMKVSDSTMSNPKKDPRAIAQQFFNISQNNLSPKDFTNIRTLLLSLKVSGDKKDIVTYTKTAKALVGILLNYDQVADGQGVKLLELLLFIVPAAYRQEMEKVACNMRYERSVLKKHLADSIVLQTDLELINRNFPVIMVDNSTRKAKNSSSESSLYRELQFLINILAKNNLIENESVIQSMYVLLPKKLRNASRALINEKRAKIKMSSLKEKDRIKYGEEGLKNVLFKRPSIEVQSEQRIGTDIISSKPISSDKASKSMEDSKQSNQKSPSLQMNLTRPSKRAKSVISTALNSFPKKTTPKKHSVGSDPLEQFLANAKTDIYRKATPKIVRINRRLQTHSSNAPEGTVCNICDKVASSFFIAECNHFSCLDCWVRWLKRSKTCPTCRKPTNENSLSRVVFEKEAGAGAPSLTQICASQDDNDNSSDDELEIVK